MNTQIDTGYTPIVVTSEDFNHHIWEHGHNNKSFRVAGGYKMDCAECVYLYYRDIGDGISFHEAKQIAEEAKGSGVTGEIRLK